MRIVIIGLLYICFMLAGCPEWLASGQIPYILRAFAYSFFHTSILHLAINGLTVWLIWPGRDKQGDFRNFFTALLIAFLVYPMGFRPCIGFSNVLFAASGQRIRPSWLKTSNGILFLVLMVGMCFFPQLAGTNHIAAFALGMAVQYISKLVEPIKRDARRYTARR